MRLLVRPCLHSCPLFLSPAARTVTNASGTPDNSIAAFSSFEDSSWVLTLDRSLGNRTLARVAWKFVLYCSTCSHALIPLSQTRLFVMPCLCASISLQPFVQTRLDYGPCLCTCISLQPCVSNTFDYGFLFVYPPAHTKMKVTPELENIFHRARAPNQLSIFLEKEQLFGVDDVALVCTKEELLGETLIAPAKAGGVMCDSLAEKVCINKVCALCRVAFATGRHGQPCIPIGARRPSTS